jgi:predicted  nucleic acid-binding Zn-ribbon protein
MRGMLFFFAQTPVKMGLATEFFQIDQDALSDDDGALEHEEEPSSPKVVTRSNSYLRRSFQDATLRESLLDENHELENKVRELELANATLRQSCARKDGEILELREQICDYEGQLQALKKTVRAAKSPARRKCVQQPAQTRQSAGVGADTTDPEILERLTEELHDARRNSHQAQEDAATLQDQLEEVERQRCDLQAELDSVSVVMKETELSFESERQGFQQRIKQLSEDVEALTVERSGVREPDRCTRNSLLAQLRKSGEGALGRSGAELSQEVLPAKLADLERENEHLQEELARSERGRASAEDRVRRLARVARLGADVVKKWNQTQAQTQVLAQTPRSARGHC